MPNEVDDSLSSVQFASILDFISEGEIDQIEGGAKGVYLNETPLQSADGTENFQGYEHQYRAGTQDQTYIPTLNGTENEVSVNSEILEDTPVVRAISNTLVDRARITITIPSFRKVLENGDVEGAAIKIEIWTQPNGGSYGLVKSDTFSGKTSDRYQRDYLIDITGAFPINVKVVRVGDDVDPSGPYPRTFNKTFWSSMTEIIDEKLRYPNSALSWIRFNSKHFPSIPKRRFLVRGVKVKVPSNATVDTTTHLGRITYAGIWDGTFKVAKEWTNDPAWCLYDLITDTRYGCSVPENTLDKWDFYNISQYSNELVSDGKGGQEVRFSTNLYITDRTQIYTMIKNMTSVFRGISYYAAGSLVVNQDKAAVSQYVLGPSNVVGGVFKYEGTSSKARHTTATVAYQNYDKLGEVSFEYVEDVDGIVRYGIINKDLKSIGCYSQGQAHRVGKWLLLSEQALVETCTFQVDSVSSGIIIRPGMVIDIADPLKADTRRSGRIKSATTTEVTLDLATNLSVDLNNDPKISVLLPKGSVETRNIDASTTVSSGVIKVTSAFSEAPNAQSVWLIQTSDIQSQQYRVTGVKEEDDGTTSVLAVMYNESIYNAVEQDLLLSQRDITNLTDKPDAVSNLDNGEFLYQSGNSVLVGSLLSWTSPVSRVDRFEGRYKIDNDNWTAFSTKNPSITLRSLRAGVLKVEIQAFNFVNKGSNVSTGTFTLAGKTAVPSDVTNLTFESISNNSGRLRWDKATDLDVLVGGSVEIRSSNLTDGSATWANSVSLIQAKSGEQTEAIVPLIEGEVLVKFKDSSGFVSTNAASVIIDLPDTIQPITVLSQREDQISPTPFSGAKTNVEYIASQGGLVLTTQGLDGEPSFDAIADLDAVGYGDVASTGTYLFANQLDLGGVYSLDLIRHFATVGYLPDDDLDNRAATVDTYGDWDGAVNNVDAKLYVRKTNDDPASGGASWSAFQEFANGTFKGRGFEFKTILTSTDTDENIKVTQLGYGASFKRRQEQSVGTIASGAGTKTITFGSKFFTGTSGLGGSTSAYLPSVGIIVQNLSTGDYIDGPTVTGTNFSFTIRNSSGAAINKNFTWSATGYGLGV